MAIQQSIDLGISSLPDLYSSPLRGELPAMKTRSKRKYDGRDGQEHDQVEESLFIPEETIAVESPRDQRAARRQRKNHSASPSKRLRRSAHGREEDAVEEYHDDADNAMLEYHDDADNAVQEYQDDAINGEEYQDDADNGEEYQEVADNGDEDEDSDEEESERNSDDEPDEPDQPGNTSNAPEPDLEEYEHATDAWLDGNWRRLDDACRAFTLLKAEKDTVIKNMKPYSGIVNRCNLLRREMRDSDTTTEDVCHDLAFIIKLTDAVEKPGAKGERDRQKDLNIRNGLMPALARLLRSLVAYLESHDCHPELRLELILDVWRCMSRLRTRMDMKQYRNPFSHLRDVTTKLSGLLENMKVEQERPDAQRAEEAAWLMRDRERSVQRDRPRPALTAEQLQEQKEEAAQIKQREKKWNDLHSGRQGAHGFESNEARDRHRVPHHPDKESFGPRRDLVDAARSKHWDPAELGALAKGLQKYCGDSVFEQIMHEHCGPGGLLRAYTVTEIVTSAAELKVALPSFQKRRLGHVEDWVERIPSWVDSTWLHGENAADLWSSSGMTENV